VTTKITYFRISYFLLCLTLFQACKTEPDDVRFQLLSSEETGIDFSNDLTPTKEQNIFSYMYFYNGSGVGAGDFNNDGMVDLYFAANMNANKMYLNKSKMRFEDITDKAFDASETKTTKGWSNGVSVVDINQDGMLDIYVSQVGGFAGFTAHNQLFICKEITVNGIPVYEEKSKEYGLDLVGLGTQAAFFDYDLDGDLDMFQLNHSLHQNGTFGRRTAYQGITHPTAGDRLFQNNSVTTDKGFEPYFTEVTKTANILDDALGYGLGIAVGDVNFDGYPDMYVGNDFHENDYLYINQKDGSFKEDLVNEINHTSRFTMGVDIADINNDVFSEIISLDMLPYDRQILKSSEGEDSYSIHNYKLTWGYNQQFSRNNLQLNNGNGTFSEIGLFANVFATDWSWSPLWMDFDNDGRKDLFVANGIPKRMNDIDYLMFVGDEDIQQKVAERQFDENDKRLIDKLPEIKIPNKFFLNSATLQFQDIGNSVENNVGSYSNGAVYADLDNDGDLDIVTNNIDEKAFVYENFAEKYAPQNASLIIELKGNIQNKNAIGAKCLVFKKDGILTYEKFPTRGFQSSMEVPLCVGLGNTADVDSILLIWPDNRFQKVNYDAAKKKITLSYSPQLPIFDYVLYKQEMQQGYEFEDITKQTALAFTHVENNFNEFDQRALLPHMMSSEGPALAVSDINQDGLDDVFIGASVGNVAKVFLQKSDGTFREIEQPDLASDKTYEDIDAVFADVNSDSFPDLIIASGGNQFAEKSEFLQPRVYLNDGKGKFTRKKDAFENITVNASSLKVADFTDDGKPDILIGGRLVVAEYGISPNSYLLKNDGKGHFQDVTAQIAPELTKIGLVKSVEVIDIDKDNDPDILVALGWGGICLLENQRGKFTKKELTTAKGWWNFMKPFDFDNDGDVDVLVGNLGLNSRLKATEKEPVRLYVNDFDKNGTMDQVLTSYLNHEEVLFGNKRETETQFPFIKKQFIFAKDFAKANVSELLGEENIKNSQVLEVNYFANAILENDGKGNFSLKVLPYDAQFSPFYAAEIMDVNNDKLPDILLMGNFYDVNIQRGQYDADHGTLLLNKGKNVFVKTPLNGLQIRGQVRRSSEMMINKRKAFILAKNNGAVEIIRRK
jgi:hypothetical protein